MNDRIFEIIFWSGFLLSIIAFFYKPILIFLGASLMIFSLIRELIKMKTMKKVNVIIGKGFYAYKVILLLVVSGGIFYLIYNFFHLLYKFTIILYGIISLALIVLVVFLIYKLKNKIKLSKVMQPSYKIEKVKGIKKKLIISIFYFLMIGGTILYIIYFREGLGYWLYGSAVFLVILFSFVLIFLLKGKKFSKIFVRRAVNKYETDLDILLEMINERKKVTITQIAEAFKINKELAEEWGKILENEKLAVLAYPAFGEVEIRSLK